MPAKLMAKEWGDYRASANKKKDLLISRFSFKVDLFYLVRNYFCMKKQ